VHGGFHDNPALVVALALAAGVSAQVLARHLRIPGIVLLLGAGVVLGPDLVSIIEPEVLGPALDTLVGFAVAIILFEGGLNLDLKRIRGQAPVIRRLLSVGVVVTAGGAAVAARYLLGWQWTPSLLFGTLVIVTGPTVVTPLLRRIRVNRNIETILETEGVLIDAVGAIIAVVALEIALGHSLTAGAISAPTRLGVGLVVGGVGGLLMASLLRLPRAVPEGLESIFTLALTLALYQVSNALIPESGIMAAITAGAVVGNSGARSARGIREFKEQLTTLAIGMLFVLLAADVRVAAVVALGLPGLWVVLALIFVVRPLNVALCTVGANLNWREKAFLGWVAPRGIVAAAVAALFADRLSAGGLGEELRALVFLVIAATVVVQGATASFVARLLGLRRPTNRGFAIFGATPLGCLLGRELMDHGHEVVVIDADARKCKEAEAQGLRVVYGNALSERVLLRSQMDTRRAAIGATHNEAMNLLFVDLARRESHVPNAYAVGERNRGEVTPEHVRAAGACLLFGNETDPELWSVRIRRGTAEVQTWRREDDSAGDGIDLPREAVGILLPVFGVDAKGGLVILDGTKKFTTGRTVRWLVFRDRAAEAADWLAGQGWVESPPETREATNPAD